MCAEPETEITVKLTNESIFITDDDTVEVSYWSDLQGKHISRYYTGVPSDDTIVKLLRKSEKCDAAWSK